MIILLYDYARSHVAKMRLQKLIDLEYKTFSHSFYSPGLSSTNFHLLKHPDIFLC